MDSRLCFGRGSNAWFGRSWHGSGSCFLGALLVSKVSFCGGRLSRCPLRARRAFAFGCCKRRSGAVRFACFGVLLRQSWALLWRFVACAMCFGSGRSPCARRCKRSAQVPNNRPTRRCTRPFTASLFSAVARSRGCKRRVSLVVVWLRGI